MQRMNGRPIRTKVVIVVRTLYGIKYLAMQFQNCFFGTIGNMLGYRSSVDEPDLWYKPMTDTDYFEYYSYILVYVDDLLLIMKCSKETMAQIQERFTGKHSIIEEPKSYIEVDINIIYYSNG